MNGLPQIRITKRKDGRETAWFKDTLGRRVGTRSDMSWVKAEQLAYLARYGIELQEEQLDAGLGSDGQAMPDLRAGGSRTTLFVVRVNGVARFTRLDYPAWKSQRGLKPMRDLYGPGKDGHMRADIRINYLDDRQAKISITRQSSRVKALANERRAPWWGWSQESFTKLVSAATGMFSNSVADYLVAVGLMSANAVQRVGQKVLRRAA